MNYLIIGLALLAGLVVVGSFFLIKNWDRIESIFHLKH